MRRRDRKPHFWLSHKWDSTSLDQVYRVQVFNRPPARRRLHKSILTSMDAPPEITILVVDFPVLEAEMSITVISGIAYGLVFSLYLSCFRGLLQGKKKSSLRRRLFLTYITCMLFASTGGIVQNMTKMIGDVLSLRKLANGGFFGIPRAGYFSSSTLAYILAIWGVDSLLVRRYVVALVDVD